MARLQLYETLVVVSRGLQFGLRLSQVTYVRVVYDYGVVCNGLRWLVVYNSLYTSAVWSAAFRQTHSGISCFG